MGSLKRRFTQSAIALAIALPAGSLTAWADTASGGSTNSSFAARYQQNLAVQAKLMQTAQSLSVNSSQTAEFQQKIQALTQQIQALYQSEQALAAQLSAQSGGQASGDSAAGTSGGTSGSGATAGSGTAAGATGGSAASGAGSAAASAQLQALVRLRAQLLQQLEDIHNWLKANAGAAVRADVKAGPGTDKGPGKGHGKGHDKEHGKDRGKDHHPPKAQPLAAIHAKLQALHQLTQQLTRVEQQIAHLQQTRRDDRGDDQDRSDQRKIHKDEAAAAKARLEALAKLQAAILKLQQEVIATLNLWIRVGGGSAGSPGQPGGLSAIAGVNLSADGRTVAEAGIVTFTAQLVDRAGKPVKQAGVQVDFAFAPGAGDGTLSTASAVTDGNGQASVKVTAGNTTGEVELSATVDGSSLRPRYSPIVHVVDASQYATHLTVSGGSFPISLVAGHTTAGMNLSVLPQNDQGQTVGGDTLRLSSSNPYVLSFAGAGADGAVTLAPGNYTLPVLVAKHAGSATVTITDVTEVTHPSLSYTVNVAQTATPYAVAVINPDGGKNTSWNISVGGLVGPFTIAVVDQNGNVVPINAELELTAAQVNEIIGAGTGIRLAPSGPDVNGLVIPAGQSRMLVWADGVTAGTTRPTAIPLASIDPVVMSITVKDAHTVAITYSEPLNAANAPAAADYTVVDGSFSGSPQSVSVSGNVVTLTLPSTAVIQHGDAVTVSYNPGTDANAVQTVWGAKAAGFASATATNPL
ncbi:MAG: hypothetical protein K6T30_01410 [Alicyclobacillus sp.]|nr:hypothetical protein [Alicyclobacillus sp.]